MSKALRLLARPRPRQPSLRRQAAQQPNQTLGQPRGRRPSARCQFPLPQRSALEAFHRRLKARLGAPKAITATAHKLACLIYRMLRFGTDYLDRGQDYYERRYRGRVIAYLTRRAQQLEYTLTQNDSSETTSSLACP